MSPTDPPLLRRLLEPGDPATPEQIAAEVRADFGGRNPSVAVNMVGSVDGTATLGGRSGGLSGPADRALFHALRGATDAVLVGAATAVAEGYGPMRPIACIASRRLALPPDLPLLRDPASRVVILTGATETLPPTAASVEYLREGDLGASLRRLHERWGVERVLCEGGPRLNATLFEQDLVDELLLTISPVLAGGSGVRIVDGPPLTPPRPVQLASLFEHGDFLFARYRVKRA
ncbi:MAG TPA: dihydrofolate reductase family protein [Solirubrobacteraceae bacterium]|jgi:5-amino-6-(5-phosphoribosylamino)uracil reductase|nr:dihydrofolate reductase family protein [Solirubrobacteraceae bacterium]